jgi:very-short-patch-repair endonuclease
MPPGSRSGSGAHRGRTRNGSFRRQHPVGRRIVDFACPERKLAIELDGGQHADRHDADTARSAELAQHGYAVIRFWNVDVTENLEGVLQLILMALEKCQHPT